MKGKLYVIPAFLGNIHDPDLIPKTNQLIISQLKHWIVENERTARRFISALKLKVDIQTLEFITITSESTANDIQPYLNWIHEGFSVGLMSEVGCPGIADPGSLAVQLAHTHSIEVVPLTGASSIYMALMGSGLNGQRFCFHGYLPIEKHERINALKQLEKDSKSKNQTQIWIETPYRSDVMLQAILDTCHPDTLLCVASGLLSETTLLKTLRCHQWIKNKPTLGKIPTVFLMLHPHSLHP